MKERLVFGLAAVTVVAGLVAWGLRSPAGSAAGQAAGKRQHARAVGSPGALPSAASTPWSPAAGHGWRLAFHASFTGSRLDTATWSTCYPWADTGPGCTNTGNTEHEWYQPSQVRVRGGALRLVARRTPTLGTNRHGAPEEYGCRSGMVTSYPGFRFRYGYVQVVAHIPSGNGLWPALWLAAANLHWPPEIDMLEHWGRPLRLTGVYLHPLGGRRVIHHVHVRNLSVGWHTFALSWASSKLVWYIDGHKMLTLRRHIPHQRMYFVANLAEAQRTRHGWGCDGTMLVRSVKVWQRAGG